MCLQNVFADPGAIITNVRSSSPRVVSPEQNNVLIAEVTFEEFSIAMNQMHPDKVSGPDGLNPTFYQSFWKVLGKDVFECCRDWLQGNSFPTKITLMLS